MTSETCSSKIVNLGTEAIIKHLRSVLPRLDSNVIPELCILPWISLPKQAWSASPGPFEQWRDLLVMIKRVHASDFGRSIERDYFERKMLVRNCFVSSKFWLKIFGDAENKIPGIQFCNVRPEIDPPELSVIKRFYEVVLQPRPITWSKSSIFSVMPPAGSTGMGVCYDDDLDIVVTGDKRSHWVTAMRLAAKAVDYAIDSRLTWDVADDETVRNKVIQDLHLVFAPTVRLDRGTDKLRLLFIGNAFMYIIETSVAKAIKEDMKRTANFGYHGARVTEWMERWGDSTVASGDYSAFDLHISAAYMRIAWKAWQEIYGLPESVMVMLYIYSTYAPIALEKSGQPYLQDKVGNNPSGAGAFVIINNLLCKLFIAMGLSKFLHVPLDSPTILEYLGISFGDDHVFKWPKCDPATWSAFQSSACGMVAGVKLRRREAVFLRNIVSRTKIRPIVFSRIRNACSPEDPNYLSRPDELNAIALRAQLTPFTVLAREESSWAELTNIVVPRIAGSLKDDRLMLNYEDDVLQQRLNYVARDFDALFFAKRLWNVSETRDLFSDLN